MMQCNEHVIGLLICCNGSQNSGKRFTCYYWFIIKDIIKDANEQPDEEVHRARSGRILSTGASIPAELELCYPSSMWMQSQTREFFFFFN